MSYLVLARKYRPTSFADIVGQDHVVRTLKNAIALDRVHHAFLFTGARGVGKTTTARVLARALNCEKGPTADPCGVCAACKEIASGGSPDVLEIDGASNTGVDNVRELRETVRYLPSRGRCKLYIIDEVHMLSTAAFNALLKTLEEPPPHVKFIFATTEPHKIPVTILSRCQRFDFRKVSVPQLLDHVRGILAKEGLKLGPTALSAIVREAQGSVRDALSLLDQVLSFAGETPDDGAVAQALGLVERETIVEMAGAVLRKDAPRLLELVAEADLRGHDLGDVVNLLVEHLRDLTVVKVVAEPSAALLERSPGELEVLRAQAEQASRPDLHRYFALAVAVAEDVSRSAQPRVSLEMGLLRLLEVAPAAELADLLQRLDALAGGKGSGDSGGSGPRSGPPSRPSPQGPPAQAQGAQPQAQAPAQAQAQAQPQKPQPQQARPNPSTSTSTSTSTKDEAPAEAKAVAAPPAAGDTHTAWQRLVERARGQRPAMASVLEHARVLRFGPDGVELGYERGSFYLEAARDPELRDWLLGVLQESLGGSVPLTVVPVDEAAAVAAPASLAEESTARHKQRKDEITQSARTHPAVQSAIDILGGQITEVHPLAADAEEI